MVALRVLLRRQPLARLQPHLPPGAPASGPARPPRGRARQARGRPGRGAGLGARGEEKAEDAGAPAVGGDVQRGDAVGVQPVKAAPGLLQPRQPLEPRDVVLPRGSD